MTSISICALDDHPIIAEGIRLASEQTIDICCSGSAGTFAEFHNILANTKVDVAIIDVKINDENISSTCRVIKAHFPHSRAFPVLRES